MSDPAELRFFNLGLAKGREIGTEETTYRILATLERNATGEYKQVMLTPKLISEIKSRAEVSAPTFKTYAEEIAYKRGFVDGDLFAEERIIKLLEAKADNPCCCFTATFGEHELPDLIALIKGENK